MHKRVQRLWRKRKTAKFLKRLRTHCNNLYSRKKRGTPYPLRKDVHMAKKQKDCATTIPQNSPVKERQLDLFVCQGTLHKPQILSISVKQRDRYRVMIADEVLGNFSTRVDSSQETKTSKN